ncbi:alpha/beta hydrolase [Nonomuraea aurantiaca]|uniref:alpha/beta hydrolase n=1 Tax=Nonomuraea aurantiaca TaxID=2878562 RepID=UPI001CD9F1DE|nr:alpha/beta hydrolase [Nonomuraea aurantiaca]MCA2222368.1 alpha/beta hydrolase [Nonomuraea aurantiaca]
MLRMLTLAGSLAFGAVLALPGQHSGRLVKVYGDLATADRVAIVVPGADTTVATFEASTKRPGGAARALMAEAAKVGHGERLAVIAWLGYDAPPTWSLGAITDTAAIEGAKALRRTVMELHGRTSAPIALLCHSYGSVVCAKAGADLPVADVALFGSPGIDASSNHAPYGSAPSDRPPSDHAPSGRTPSDRALSDPALSDRAPSGRPLSNALSDASDHPPSDHGAAGQVPSPARVWAGVGGSDWIRFVPKVKLGPLGFGADALSPGYGARVFEVGPGGHSDYFAPGTPSLRNLTLIALGRPGDVTAAAPA